MDMDRGINDRLGSHRGQQEDEIVMDRPLDIGTDERRMHVRAYNHWVSLLKGRPYPSIEDLDPDRIHDFGAHSVLLDFTGGIDNPAIRYLGHALRVETQVDGSITHVEQVPSRSLLSRLTDHYLQIIANCAPIGFEAEFLNQRGNPTVYRGILMPFSSNGETIDFIYGVINWKELVDAATQGKLNTELDEARRTLSPLPAASTPIWADGPSAGFVSSAAEQLTPASLADAGVSTPLNERLVVARESAAAARASDTRSRSALYRALSRAYEFVLAVELDEGEYARLLENAGLKRQERAPMTPAVKLIFGGDYDKTRVTEFAAVLAYAKRSGIPADALDAAIIENGGIKGVVKAERELRRPPALTDMFTRITQELRTRAPMTLVDIESDSEFVVLVARAGKHGMDIVASIDDDALTQRALRKAAA